MTHELILTSVPQGLEPDDTGFCPVAADATLPPSLAVCLKQLSSYRHIDTDIQQNRFNPVCYSHIILAGSTLTDSTAAVHVLSRISDAGTDFQNQPNTLAHHITLDATEINSEGPAWTLSLPGFHLTCWEPPCVRFPAGRPIPKLTVPPPLTRRQQIARERRWCDPHKTALFGNFAELESPQYRRFVHNNDEQIALTAAPTTPCPCWKELTDDAGWGGVLAETLLTSQRAVIVFNPGQNLLPLFLESLAMLPQAVLWRGTFTTYYTGFPNNTGLPENAVCQWKGCLAGSPEAQRETKDSAALVIDLTQTSGRTPQGAYVEFARQGIDYLLPNDKENTDTLFQSLLDSDTKGYTKGNAPANAAKQPTFLPVMPAVQPQKPQKTQNTESFAEFLERFLVLRSRGQFYVLYTVMILLILMLVFLLLDEKLHFGIVKKHQTDTLEAGIDERQHNEQQHRNPLDAAVMLPNKGDSKNVTETGNADSDNVESNKAAPNKDDVKNTEAASVLDEEKTETPKELPPPVIPSAAKIPVSCIKDILEKQVFPLPDDWQKYYELQEQKPPVRLEIKSSENVTVIQPPKQTPEDLAKLRLEITVNQTYKKIIDAGTEGTQRIRLPIIVEASGKELRWTDLYEAHLQELQEKQKQLAEQRAELKTKIEAAAKHVINGEANLVNNEELEQQKAEQERNSKKLAELADLLEAESPVNSKLEKAHKELLENDRLTIPFKIFFGDPLSGGHLVLETE
ncbi:MAG: hypothetical protein LBT46_10160 [Planctomycetaceae bacterium]|jgi:hypothetical protein|nr:hypothetical protein [Planctomycetaceae bacterium]